MPKPTDTFRRLSMLAATGAMLAALAACGEDDTDISTDTADTPAAAQMRDDDTGALSPETTAPEADEIEDELTAGVGQTGASLDGPDLAGALTQGEWVYKEADPAALFGPVDSEALFSLWCNADTGTVAVQKAGQLDDQNQVAIELITDQAMTAVYATQSDGPMPILEGSLDLDELFLTTLPDATRLAVMSETTEKLLMPIGEPVGRMIEECRNRSGG